MEGCSGGRDGEGVDLQRGPRRLRGDEHVLCLVPGITRVYAFIKTDQSPNWFPLFYVNYPSINKVRQNAQQGLSF